MAAVADRLSDLPEDLRARVISFLPTKDAARSTVLSRQWRTLWLHSAALNLDTTSYTDLYFDTTDVPGALFRDAKAALGAPGRPPVTALSLFVKESNVSLCASMLRALSPYSDDSSSIVDDLLAEPALRRVEELRVQFKLGTTSLGSYVFKLHLSNLRGDTIRVLDLQHCMINLPPPPPTPTQAAPFHFLFPRLAALHLKSCTSTRSDMHALTRAAPNLTSLHVEQHQRFSNSYLDDDDIDRFVLHCPRLTDLTFGEVYNDRGGIHLHAPRLRTFKYSGLPVEFSMESQATELMSHVDLNIDARYVYNRELIRICFTKLLKFIRSIGTTKSLKLRVPKVESIAVDHDVQGENLVILDSLQHLELQLPEDPYQLDSIRQLDSRRNAAIATTIASLLYCCPKIHELQLSFSPRVSYEKMPQSKFDVSTYVFKKRGSNTLLAQNGVPLIPRNLDDEDDCLQVPDIQGLAGCLFNCLQNHLKRVKLQFQFSELDSFEVGLAKFFVENCKVLEVLEIDDGIQNFGNHINRKVEIWRANASKLQDK